MPETKKIVGAAVTALLEKKGKDYKWLAEQMECSHNYTCNVKNGKVNVGLLQIERIASIFKVKLSQFFKLGEEALKNE